MKWFRLKFPISIHEKVTIEQHVDWLLAEFGSDAFLGSEILTYASPELVRLQLRSAEDLNDLVDFVANRLPFDVDEIEFEIVDNEADLDEPRFDKPVDCYIREYQISDVEDAATLIVNAFCNRYIGQHSRIGTLLEDSVWCGELIGTIHGFGVIQANSAFKLKSYGNGAYQGWMAYRQTNVPARIFGVFLGFMAWMREQPHEKWSRFLLPDAAVPFKRSLKFLTKTSDSLLVVNKVNPVFNNENCQELLSQFELESESTRYAIGQQLYRNMLLKTESSHAVTCECIRPLLFDRKPEIQQYGCYVVQAMDAAKDSDLDPIVSFLSVPNPELRRGALLALAKHARRGQEDVYNIRMHMTDADSGVSSAAIIAAGDLKIDDRRIVKSLLKCYVRYNNLLHEEPLQLVCESIRSIVKSSNKTFDQIFDEDEWGLATQAVSRVFD